MLVNGKTAIEGLSGSARAAGRDCAASPLEPHPVDPHRPGDVLKLLFAGILEGDIELASRIFLYAARNADPARFREALETGRHIHAVAEDVAAVDDDIADIDANAELDPPLLRHVGIPLEHAALDLDGTAQRIDHARELGQHTVAVVLTIRPWCSSIFGSSSACRWAFNWASVPSSSAPISRL